MGRVYWITSVAAAAAVIYGLNMERPDRVESVVATEVARADVVVSRVEPEIGTAAQLRPSGQNGFALATAAFGMSALQPETYDGDMVANIIAASPLEELEKVQLTSSLQAAELGEADLHRVLSNVRSALAVE
ncbi:MAG: hypothetical protein HKN27_07520 [Silicimonas sp.]|nr:hypothetical protein [Silicimonas sp.]